MSRSLLIFVLTTCLISYASSELVRCLEVSENVSPGTRVGFINVDSPPYLIVPVSGSSVEADLIVEQITGEIRTRVSLDRETRPSYSLVALPQNIRVIVTVLDENDNIPKFAVEYVNVEFPENAPHGSKRTLPPARDPDLGLFSTQRYELITGNNADAFRLISHRGRDGVLYLDLQSNGMLDHEAQDNYQLVIEALDGGTPPLHSQLFVNVTIQDVNDNPPFFEHNRYATNIPENTTVGTSVLIVHATDIDSGDNGCIEYSINRRQSDRDEMFRVDPENGTVYVNKALDFELHERHELVVVARDRGAQPLETSVFVLINVNDVNDNQPAITVIYLSDDATPKISESAQRGEFVARISVSDPDFREAYSNATVSLNGGDGHFGLTIRDDVVYLVLIDQSLDREDKSLYELSVEATDSGTPPLRAVRTFRLLVTDINDNAPQFSQVNYEAHLLEASEPGTSVLRVNAKDADDGPNAHIQYSLLNATWFTIDENSGLITTVTHIDCESDPAPLLIVVASDSGKPPLSGSATVRVTVHDVNDNEPIFEKPMYNISVSEDLPVDHCFIKVLAIDSDCGVNAMVNYSLIHSTKAVEQFIIRSDTGDICIRTALDREVSAYHELLVIATDRGGLSSTSIVRVFITDINDNSPIFQPQKYNVTLRIDALTNEPIIRCNAFDADIGLFGRVSYRISGGNEAGIFSINQTSGEIYVERHNILTSSSVYLLNITASDAIGFKTDTDAFVQIITTSIDEKFSSCDRPRYNINIKENVAQNTFIVSIRAPNILSANDNVLNRYYLLTEESDFFFEKNTGTVRTKVPLDREIQDHYILNVEFHNEASIGYCQIDIIVEDINDNSPSFPLKNVRISVAESYSLYKVFYVAYASDPDIIPAIPLRYVLIQNNTKLFDIDDESGEVFLVRRLDYEAQQYHQILVHAFDGAGLSANLSLNIDVQDVNDNPPVFEKKEYYTEIAENIELNSEVTAVDLDTGNNARLKYRLQNAGPFYINPNTGSIMLVRKLDRETVDHYNLTTLAIDNGLPAVTATASVIVSILDDNDNEPHFEKNLYEFELFENLPSGMLVGTVVATDADINNNALIKYTIIQNNSSFFIDLNTGEIRTRKPLDRETKSIHELMLEARDQGVPSRTTRVPLKIYVLDVNDNSPEIVDPQEDVVSVREEQPSGTAVVRIKALDYDLGDNASITYSILKDRDSDSYNAFNIDSISGVIKTKVVLDHEERNLYTLSIKASDSGSPSRHSIRALRVEVLALTDNRPTFTSSSLTFDVREDASIGELVGSVSDFGAAGRVTYTLESLRPFDTVPTFEIDHMSGQLIVAHLLDRENISEYQLAIRVLDTTSIGNPQSIAISVKINIKDVNDNSPRWSQDPVFIKISEYTIIGSIIYNLIASDLDEGINGDLRYSLVAEYPPTSSFVVDFLTGALMLSRLLDHEERPEFTLVLKAEDRATLSERLASTVTVKIFVVDENDNDPIFVTPENTRLTISLDTLPGSELLRVIAIDKDAGNNGRISYLISSGNENGSFSIDSESGKVILMQPFLHSTELEITANDHGVPPRKATLKLILILSAKIISGSPRILESNPITRISENLRIGSKVINVAEMLKFDQRNVTFRLLKSIASEKFNISNIGVITVSNPLNREERSYYLVPILVQSTKITDLITLEIYIVDENDNKPEFKSGSCYTLAIPENQETSIVHSFVATDRDEGKNGEISYSIINGNIDSKFKLDPVTGILSASNLDREKVSKYLLTISATDNGRPSLESHCNVTIIVIDVNDNAPFFLPNQYSNSTLHSALINSKTEDNFEKYSMNALNNRKYSTTIPEDIAVESSIMHLQAIDPDEGINGKVTYSIAGESTWLFRIDNFTGVLTTVGSLDRERENFYSFLVVATDNGKYEAHQTLVSIEIYINDINDNYPIFEEYPYIIRISVNTQPGQNIFQIKANDADHGANGEIVYISQEPNKLKFRIHPNTGMVTATSSLTQDNGQIYRLNILAMDKGNPPLSTKTLIKFYIGDILNTTPILTFKNENYNVSIQENSTTGTEIIQVTAVRSDGRRQQIIYSIGSGNYQQIFVIDNETGIVKINDSTKLDAELCNETRKIKTNFKGEKNLNMLEKINSRDKSQINEKVGKNSKYILNLIAKTMGPDPLEAYTKLIIRISDVNDNPPIFTQSQYYATVLEGIPKGDFVIKIFANDIDEGLNSRILYHIVDGNPDNAFTINPAYSGIVRTNIVLDREIREKYRLTIIATDQGTPQLTGTTVLSVRVIDINDNHPTFPERKIISISEDTGKGTIITIITANDVDTSPTLTYRFGDASHAGPFSIDHFSGRIILIDKLDAEFCIEYTLQVVATDGMHETTTELTIQVTDLNDNSPQFNQVSYLTTLIEEQDNIQEVLIMNATDSDLTEKNKVIHYRLLDPFNGFTIHSTTGVILVNRTALSKSISKEIELVVIAEDSGKPSLKTICSVVISLNSLKNNIPIKEYKLLIKENMTMGTSLLKLSDIDLIDGTIISGNESEFFEISRGKLILIKPLDRELIESHVVHIGNKKENSTTNSIVEEDLVTVIINVDDVNDNYPRFIEELYQVTIKEDVPFGYTVAILDATDNDLLGTPASIISYDIISGNEAKLFCIDKRSGVVMINNSLDFDVPPDIYKLIIIACDSDPLIILCSLTRLYIHLDDVNDNSPKFPISEYLEFVGENEPIGTELFTARAFDLDRGIHGKLNYSIISAAVNEFPDVDESWNLFSIDSNSGVVKTRSIFDYEQCNHYTFTLCATDNGGHTAAVKVRVEIDSRDEFYPQFTERMYRFVIKKGTDILPGIIIGYVIATDKDKGTDGRVVYQLKSQHQFFKLNRTTGALLIKQKLTYIDLNDEEFSRLVISASSGKQGSLSNITEVEISLIDNNDLIELKDAAVITMPMNTSTNIAVAAGNGLADWVLGLLIILLLIVIAFSSIFLYLHIKNRHKKKPNTKSGFNGESNATTSNSYVDPTAFDTIPIRSVTGIVINGNNSNITGNIGGGVSCQFAPPKYDEIPPYGTSGQSEAQAVSELSGTDQSGSSGRGSAEDDEIRMINENQQIGDSASDLSVHNTQEYLAKLGIVDPPIGASRRPSEALPLHNSNLFEDESTSNADIATSIYGKIGNLNRPTSDLEVPGGPSMNGSLSSIVHSEEELTGSYNWDYLLDWGPQYQPLAHVFSEIARLKDDSSSMQSNNFGSSSKIKFMHTAPPPPLLTSVAPRLLTVPTMARVMLPRSPISHDTSTFPAAALSPSFSPSLSPLATRSPSISPLVPNTTPRINQCSPRGIPVNDTELRM